MDRLAGEHRAQAVSDRDRVRAPSFGGPAAHGQVVHPHTGRLQVAAVVQREHPPGVVDRHDAAGLVDHRRRIGQGVQHGGGQPGAHQPVHLVQLDGHREHLRLHDRRKPRGTEGPKTDPVHAENGPRLAGTSDGGQRT